MNRALAIGAAGVVVTIMGFAKTIPPLIEVGVALIIIALITKPASKA